MDFRDGLAYQQDIDEPPLRLSAAADKLLGQPMFGLLSKAAVLERRGRRIIHFEIGDPSFDSPPEAINAAVDALQQGQTHYTLSRGLLAFRERNCRIHAQVLGIRAGLVAGLGMSCQRHH